MISIRDPFSSRQTERRYFLALVFLLTLFCMRVLGQFLVAVFSVPFLPPMEEWFSGAIPYPELLACQIVIILLYGKACIDFARRRGIFVMPNKRLGSFLLHFGTIYLSVMLIRYVIRMGLYPTERWIGGSIPIFFHWVLASFLLVLGSYHWLHSKQTPVTNAVTAPAGPADDDLRAATGIGRSKLRFARAAILWGTRTIVTVGVFAWIIWQLLPSALAFQHGLRPPLYAVREQHGVSFTTSDGIDLVADIYHPQHTPSTPTILVRIPLSKSFNNSLYANLMGRIWAERGYTVVIQGTRGRFGSGGKFYPLRCERQDGIETLRWLKNQPWFNGQIATWGGSAFGYTQWSISDQLDPGPSVLDIYESTTDFHKMFYPGGAFSLSSALSWAVASGGSEDLPKWPSKDDVTRWAKGMPLLDADKRATGTRIEFFRDWALHNTKDSYWHDIDASSWMKDMHVPALLMAGWYDPFLPAQIGDFAELRRSAQSNVAKRSRLVIGPWTHAGEVVFPNGEKATPFRQESFVVSLPWFDQILTLHQPPNRHIDAPVQIFVMGRNEWRDEQEWPLARTRYIPLYLQSSGHANGGAGGEIPTGKIATDGVLALSKPSAGQPVDRYIFDPRDPVPTNGGAVIGSGGGIACQDKVEHRPDVLVYTTPELRTDLEITGPVSLLLYVSTSAPQTDFTAKLVDVHPDGSPFNVSDGILRRSYESHAAGESSAINEIKIDLWPTSMVFGKGHRIRLEVSSSNFPRYDRNPNTRNFIPSETSLVCARQSVHHSRRYPSQLILPIIPNHYDARLSSLSIKDYFNE